MSRIAQALQPRDLDAQPLARLDDRPDLLTQVQVCRRLGISDQTWMNWRKAGRAPEPVVLSSGRRKWRAVDIDDLIGRAERRPGSAARPVSRHYFGGGR